MTRELLFVTANENKLREAAALLGSQGVSVRGLSIRVEELQTDDSERLVKHKAFKAFEHVGRPLFVEHTGLRITHLGGLPGGLTQLFWDRLQAERFCELFGNTADTSVTAQTIIGYVDGRRCHIFQGQAKGRIPEAPSGPQEFQWDPCFIPDGEEETYADMGMARKNEISMRTKAFAKFTTFLRGAQASG